VVGECSSVDEFMSEFTQKAQLLHIHLDCMLLSEVPSNLDRFCKNGLVEELFCQPLAQQVGCLCLISRVAAFARAIFVHNRATASQSRI